MVLFALAAEMQAYVIAVDIDMLLLQRSQAIRLIGLGVFLIACSNAGLVQQTDDGRDYLALRQTGSSKIFVYFLADLRKNGSKCQHAAVFGFIAHLPVTRMIAVLLAPARVPADSLDMTILDQADPNIFPGGRNDQGLYPFQGRLVA